MTMQHLPRPWMLAALTDVPVAALARNGKEPDTDWASMPRPGRGAAPPAERGGVPGRAAMRGTAKTPGEAPSAGGTSSAA